MNDLNNSSQEGSKDGTVNRREFILKSAMAGVGLAMTGSASGNTFAQVLKADHKRKLGSLEVSSLGLGCMSMAGIYNAVKPKDEMVSLIRKAAESGVTFFDTAEVYGPFISEEYVGEALAPFKGKVVIASKFGFGFQGGRTTGRDSNPENIRRATECSLKRLKVEVIDLYYLHRVDSSVSIEDVAGTVKDLIKEGKIRHFGLSEASPATIRKAHTIQPVTALQSEYSIMERVVENEILSTCEELGIGFVPWGPLHRGFLTGRYDENSTFDPAYRHYGVSTFTPEALKTNMTFLAFVKEWARKKNVTPAQFSLGWLLAQKPFIVPIPGTTNPQHFAENSKGAEVKFTSKELTEIREGISKIQVQGLRKPESALVDQ